MKIKCEHQTDIWKNSSVYKEFMIESEGRFPDYVPNFTWFGSAPFCGGDACEVYKAGMLPIQAAKCGDGSCCSTGEKWLGVRPILKEHKENVKEGKKECWEFKKLQEKTLQDGLSFGTNIAKAIGSAVTPK